MEDDECKEEYSVQLYPLRRQRQVYIRDFSGYNPGTFRVQSRYQVLGTKYLVPSTLVPSSWYQVLGTKNFGTKHLVPSTWYLDCTRNVPGLYPECTWIVPGMYLDCTRCTRIVPGMHPEYSECTQIAPGINKKKQLIDVAKVPLSSFLRILHFLYPSTRKLTYQLRNGH